MEIFIAFLEKVSRMLRAATEAGFMLALAGLVIYLLLGENSGYWPNQVASNLAELSSELGPDGLVAVLAALLFYVLLIRVIKSSKD